MTGKIKSIDINTASKTVPAEEKIAPALMNISRRNPCIYRRRIFITFCPLNCSRPYEGTDRKALWSYLSFHKSIPNKKLTSAWWKKLNTEHIRLRSKKLGKVAVKS